MKIFELFGTVALQGAEKVISAVENIGKKAETVGKKFEDFGKKVEKIGDKTEEVGTALTKVLAPITALGIGMFRATKGAADFETQMSRVGAVSGSTVEDMEKLRKKARELGADTKFSATEAGQGMEFLGQAGWSTGQIMSGIEPILKMAEGQQMDLAKAAEITTDVMGGFGLAAKDTGKVTDILSNAANISSTNINLLGESMKYAAPFAKNANMSFEQTAGFLVALSKGGVKGTQAGTTLNAVLRDLAELQNKNVNPAFVEAIGVYDKTTGKMNSMPTIIDNITKATKGMTQEQKDGLIQQAFGQEALLGINSMLNMGADELRKYTAEMHNSTGAVEKMRDIIKDDLNYQLEKTQGNFEDVTITLGTSLIPLIKDKVLPMINNLIDSFEKAVNWFSGLEKETQWLVVKFTTFFALLGPGLILLGGLISAFGVITTTIGTVIGWISGIIIALGAMGTATTGASTALTVYTGVAGSARVAFLGLQASVLSTIGVILGIAAIGTVLIQSWKSVQKIFSGIWDLIAIHAENANLRVRRGFNITVEFVLTAINEILKATKVLSKLPLGIGDKFKELSDTVQFSLKNYAKKTDEINNKIQSNTASMGSAFKTIGTGITGIGDTAKKDLYAVVDYVTGFKESVTKGVGTVTDATDNLLLNQNKLTNSIDTNTDSTNKNIKTLEEARKNLKNVQEAMGEAQKEYDKLKNSGKANTKELELAKNKLDELKNKYSEAKNLLDVLSDSKDKNTKKTKENKEENEKLKKAKEALAKATEFVIKLFGLEGDSTDNATDSLQSKSEAIKQNIESLSKDEKINKEYIKTLTEEKKKIDDAIVSLKNKKEANDLAIKSIQDGNTPVQEAILLLGQRKTAIEKEISVMKEQGIVSGSQINILNQQKTAIEDEIKVLNKSKTISGDLIKQYSEGKISIDKLREAYLTEETAIAKTNERLTQNVIVMDKVAERIKNVSDAKSTFEKYAEDLTNALTNENNANNIAIEGLENQSKAIEEKIKNSKEDNNATKEKIELLEKQKEKIDKAVISLNAEKEANDLVTKSVKEGKSPIETQISLLEESIKANEIKLNSLKDQGEVSGGFVDSIKKENEVNSSAIKLLKTKKLVTDDMISGLANGTLSLADIAKSFGGENEAIKEVLKSLGLYKEEIENPPVPKLPSNWSEKFKQKWKEFKENLAKEHPNIMIGLEIAGGIGDTIQGVLDTVLGKMDFGNVFQSLFKGDIAGTFKNLFGGIIGASEEQTKTELASIEEQRKAELAKVDESNIAEIKAINDKYDLLKSQAENSGFSGLMKRFNDSFGKVITRLLPIFDKLFIALDPMIEPMTQILEILALMLIEILKPMAPLLIKLMEIVGELLQALFPVIEPLMELAVVIIDLVLGVIRPFIPVLRIVAELFGALIRVLKPIFDTFAELFDAIFPLIEPFTKLAELVGLLIKPIEWIVDMFSKITGGVGNVVSGVGGFIGDAIGGVVDFAGGIIDGIGGLFGFANGGLVTGPTKALIGEAGYPEAVIPLKSDVLSYLGQQIAMATPSNGNLNTNSMFDDFEVSRGNGGDIIINLNGDNLVIDDISLQRFARQLFPKLEAERKRRGQ